MTNTIEEQLRTLVNRQEWSGTLSELAATLEQPRSAETRHPARLGRWLRRNEPTLWWDHGVRVQFTRTERTRQVHLSQREPLVAVRSRW